VSRRGGRIDNKHTTLSLAQGIVCSGEMAEEKSGGSKTKKDSDKLKDIVKEVRGGPIELVHKDWVLTD